MSDYEKILQKTITLINEDKDYVCYGWWVRVDFNNAYSTTKINYELSKAVKNKVLISARLQGGVAYRKNEPNQKAEMHFQYNKHKKP